MRLPTALVAAVSGALLAAAPAAAAAADLDTRPDPAAATRTLARADGALTGPATGSRADIARDYLRDERRALGLDAADVADLELARTTTLGGGAVSLQFADEQDGIPLFGGDVRVAIGADGRILSVTGAPATDADAPTSTPAISASEALAIARADAGLAPAAPAATERGGPRRETHFADGSSAKLVRFPWGDGAILGWRVLLDDPSGALYDTVVDAGRGAVLYRHSLTSSLTASTFPAWPGAPVGGDQADEDFGPWLTAADRLAGNNSHTWADLDADERPGAGEEVPPTGAGDYRYPYTEMAPAGRPCSPAAGCSWDATAPRSWETNLRQDATQVFAFVNRFHDWLLQPAIGFTEANGNFQQVNVTGLGKGGDPVNALASYGADTLGGLPNPRYLNNANMTTPPDGRPPTMRMYLFQGGARFFDTNGGDDPTVVLHEYTHGLSNRLVVDADGISTLLGPQGGAMGEAWSDWYAVDYLVAQGYATADPADPGTTPDGPVTGAFLSQPLDCPVGPATARCPGTATAGPGGYTYGDFGRVGPRGSEVHDDGEIWSETLWDLRTRLVADHGAADGAARARSLVTRAMQLSAPNPSFLDMRDAILQADIAFFGGEDTGALWDVFATRGMGFFASTSSTADTHPIEDFALPPAARGTLTGRVAMDGAPVAGAQVRLDGGPGQTATTGADGRFSIEVPAGTYHRVVVAPPSGDAVVRRDVTVPGGGTQTLDVDSRRDWMAQSGGASIASFTGADYTIYGGGPAKVIDQAVGTAWITDGPGPREITVALPRAVDVREITIDPTPDSRIVPGAALGAYRVETSTDGVTFATAATGAFGAADRGRPNPVALITGTTAAVRFVRIVALGAQGDESESDGGISMNEIAAYGTPSAAPAPTPTPSGPATPATPPASPAPSPVPAPAPAPEPARAAAPAATMRVAGRPTLRQVLRRGLPLRVRCATTCRARAVVRLPSARGLVAGVAQRRLRADRATTLRVRVRPAAARRLRDHPRARLTVTVQLTGADGATRALRRAVRLKPAPRR